VFKEIHRAADELCVQIGQRELSLRKQLSEPDPAFPDFDRDVALLGGWKAFGESVGGKMHDGQNRESKGALQIVAAAVDGSVIDALAPAGNDRGSIGVA